MAWEILWPLVLGFALSAVIQAVVRRERITALMAGDAPRALAVSAGLGAASSSCSYAAVALARSLFRKGAGFTSAMVFEIASTNLVVELGIILALAMGWQFTLAEFVAGPVMILFVALLFRLWMRKRIVEGARRQADRGLGGSMEGHAGMDMSVHMDAPFLSRLFSRPGLTATSQYFVMDWAAVIRDVVIGVLIAGAFAAWVPRGFLQAVFLTRDPTLAFVLGPLIGPLIAVVSFVCSVGNVPLAAVLWNGGISFGGVMSFIFADLIIVPILLIYRRYYGTRAAAAIAGTFYLAMAAAGYVVELLFTPLGLVPSNRNVSMLESSISWNYTTWLNIVFLALAAFLLVWFFRSGSGPMLRMMGGSAEAEGTESATAD
ncbi:MAG: permease [Acidobacteria bacterium]|nr:permease [Acidobacteriota bacterium]